MPDVSADTILPERKAEVDARFNNRELFRQYYFRQIKENLSSKITSSFAYLIRKISFLSEARNRVLCNDLCAKKFQKVVSG